MVKNHTDQVPSKGFTCSETSWFDHYHFLTLIITKASHFSCIYLNLFYLRKQQVSTSEVLIHAGRTNECFLGAITRSSDSHDLHLWLLGSNWLFSLSLSFFFFSLSLSLSLSLNQSTASWEWYTINTTFTQCTFNVLVTNEKKNVEFSKHTQKMYLFQ